MARNYAKLLCEVWDDPKHEDFLALSSDAKVLYWAFCSQRDITAAGVVPLTPRRWRKWFGGDQGAAEAALDELAAGRFVLLDDDTAEVWVRTFIAHDGRLENSNLAKSVEAAVPLIRSDDLREACRRYLNALRTPSGGGSDAVPTPRPVDNSASVPSDDKPPGRTPFERPSNVDGNDPERDPELLEPAASSHDLSPGPSSQQPSTRSNTSASDPPDDAAAAAAIIDVMVGMRLESERNIRSPSKYAAALRRDLPNEHGATIDRYRAQFPLAPASCIAAAVLTGDTRNLAHYAQENAP